jgi:hypothetical protein
MAPIESAKAYGKPMLIVQGGRDYQVNMKDFEIWKRELDGHKNVTFRLYSELDHLMHAGKGPSTPEQYKVKGHVDAEIVALIADWVRDVR